MNRKRYTPRVEGEVMPYLNGKWRATIYVDAHYAVSKDTLPTSAAAWLWCDVAATQVAQEAR